jgi:ribosomal protein S18 acetylase RimI-like enzyme
MTETYPSRQCTILHLPAGSADWAGVLAQFTLTLAAREGRAFATWAGERLLRYTRKGEGVVALADGQLRGLLLLELNDQAVELTFPWLAAPDPALASELALAGLQVAAEVFPAAKHRRVERQLLPGTADPAPLAHAGFFCRRRNRMLLELAGWHGEAELPEGYRIVPWNMRDLDAAAGVVYRANVGTLDAVLYAPFFGESPTQCRKGLLSILAGNYGPIHPSATLCAFHESTLVGVNLVIAEGNGLASIVELSVDPAVQGRGMGRALMTRTLRVLKHENYERVELAVTQDNTRAVALYDSLGFSESGEFPVCVWQPG